MPCHWPLSVNYDRRLFWMWEESQIYFWIICQKLTWKTHISHCCGSGAGYPLSQESKIYGRVFEVSKEPSGFQEREQVIFWLPEQFSFQRRCLCHSWRHSYFCKWTHYKDNRPTDWGTDNWDVSSFNNKLSDTNCFQGVKGSTCRRWQGGNWLRNKTRTRSAGRGTGGKGLFYRWLCRDLQCSRSLRVRVTTHRYCSPFMGYGLRWWIWILQRFSQGFSW